MITLSCWFPEVEWELRLDQAVASGPFMTRVSLQPETEGENFIVLGFHFPFNVN